MGITETMLKPNINVNFKEYNIIKLDGKDQKEGGKYFLSANKYH